jgi:hypothetical protein
MSDLWKPTQHEPLIYVLAMLLIILGTTPAGHARDVNPPEVQALIGMRIPAKAPGRYGDVPNAVKLSPKPRSCVKIFPVMSLLINRIHQK